MVDLHLHTTASDGALAPADLVAAARDAGLTVISITDHDTIAAVAVARDAAARVQMEVVTGIEITAVAIGRDVHMLGYFFDPGSPALTAFLDAQRADRVRRIGEIADRLAAQGRRIDVAPLLDDAARGRSIGRPDLARALVAAGYVSTPDEAFRKYLGQGCKAWVPRRGSAPAEVVEIIHRAGGLASLAHPGATGSDDLIPSLASEGLDAIEAVHSDHDAAHERRYREMAASHGLLVTGGSDFHAAGGHRAQAPGAVTLPLADFERLRAASAARA